MAGRHAYLILAHTNPGQLKKLLYALDDPRNDIFVHIDRNAPFSPKDLEGACSRAGLEFISPRIRVSWGGVSIVRAEMALLEAAVKTGHSYYHLLSGMDLPIKNQDAIHRFFEENDGYEFVEVTADSPGALERVIRSYPFPEGNHFFLTNLLNNISGKLQRRYGREINGDVHFKHGSQWFSITSGAAHHILSEKEWVEKVFRRSRICDEFLVQTLLMNSPFRSRIHPEGNRRYLIWDKKDGVRHPRTLTSEDFIDTVNSGCLWARKFDEKTDAAIIDRILSWIR